MITPRRIMIGLVVLVLLVLVAVNRLGSNPTPTGVTTGPQTASTTTGSAAAPSSSATAASTTAPSADGGHDDHGDGAEEDEPPVMVTPTERPDVREAATAFGAAWLNTYQATAETWRGGLLDRLTPELAADMTEADPASVPAGGRVGNPVKVIRDGQLLTADVPVVTAGTGKPQPLGTLHLTLVDQDGQWLVSEIDWEERP